jgi:hypothetical protein
MHGGLRRLDVLAYTGQKIEFQQAKDTVQNTHGKELAHATGVMWVFCVIKFAFGRRGRFGASAGALLPAGRRRPRLRSHFIWRVCCGR